MRPDGVAAAIRELKRADRARKRMVTALTVDDAEDAWVEFLAHAGNIYAKLKAACYGHPRDYGWYGKQLDDRGRDPLLLYIHKARNAITHRLEAVVEGAPTAVHEMNFGGRKMHVTYPTHLRLLPVMDEHGNVYDPPTSHFDVPFGYMDATLVTVLAIQYFQDLTNEASSRLR